MNKKNITLEDITNLQERELIELKDIVKTARDKAQFVIDYHGSNIDLDEIAQRTQKFITAKEIDRRETEVPGFNEKRYLKKALLIAEKLGYKIATTFTDNVRQYNPAISINNIANVLSVFDASTSISLIRQFSELVSSEILLFKREEAKSLGLDQDLYVIPYFFEDILPRVNTIKSSEEREKTIGELIIKIKDSLYSIRSSDLLTTSFTEVQEKKIEEIEIYANSLNLKRPADSLRLPIGLNHQMIKYIIETGFNGDSLPPFSMDFSGVHGSKKGSVKIIGNFPPTEFPVRVGETRKLASDLVILGEKYVLPRLQKGTPLCVQTGKTLDILKQLYC